MVFIAARFISGQGGYRTVNKAILQGSASSVPGIIANKQQDDQRNKTADDLAQRAIEKQADIKFHRVAQHHNIDSTG